MHRAAMRRRVGENPDAEVFPPTRSLSLATSPQGGGEKSYSLFVFLQYPISRAYRSR